MSNYNEEIVKNVIETIKECLNKEDLEVSMSSNLREDLKIDSVDAICFIMDLEEIYNITIDDTEIETLTDVESIVRLIEARISSGE